MMNLAERVSRIERLMLDMSLELRGITPTAKVGKIKDIAAELLEAVNAPEFRGYANAAAPSGAWTEYQGLYQGGMTLQDIAQSGKTR